jgi:hypothetical protein
MTGGVSNVPTGWKFAQEDGTDHYTGTINYRGNVGKELAHPDPDTKSADACGCGYHLGKTLRGAGEYSSPGAVFRCSYSRRDVLGEDEYKVRVSRLTVLEEVPAWKGYGPRGKRVQDFIDSLADVPWLDNVGEPYEPPSWATEMKQVNSRYAARYAAWYAARDAARDAAWDAARYAAWDAAWYAAWDAARDAAWDAAWDAAGYAAGYAAGDAAWDAARDAAWDAAGYAAWDAAEIMGGIEDGYYAHMMEVYRAGHYPCSYDGETLVVY